MVLMNKTCSVKNCFQDRDWGDRLFCKMCREQWVRFCYTQGILAQSNIPENILNDYLTHFQTFAITKNG